MIATVSSGYFRNFRFHTITFTTLLFSDSFLLSQPFKLGLPIPPLIFISADADHRCFNWTIPKPEYTCTILLQPITIACPRSSRY
ncbi:hypothetical protein Hdeb2414_s0017g00506231 [Helianthus debilis subsp. tardiflorus]